MALIYETIQFMDTLRGEGKNRNTVKTYIFYLLFEKCIFLHRTFLYGHSCFNYYNII